MGFASQGTQQKLPFLYNAVFDGIVTVMPTIGFSLKSQDRVIGRITASTGMSLFSWGENIAIVVEKVDDGSTLVAIESALKLGSNVAGSHRHAKNFNKLIEALSSHLQSRFTRASRTSPKGIDMAAPKYLPWYCPKCKEQVMAVGRPNHFLHLILTVCTCGWWGPVWIVLAIRRGPVNCPKCGTPL